MKKTAFTDGAFICSYNTLNVPVRGCRFHLLLLFQICVLSKKKILMLTKTHMQEVSIEKDSSSPNLTTRNGEKNPNGSLKAVCIMPC